MPTSTCGIVTTDGSEDDNIHCLKSGQMAANTAATIAAETAKLNNREEVEYEDDNPFAYHYEEDECTLEDE